jgi:prophage DNA circulation protein
MPAWAVRQPGVLSFLEALRRSGRIPGFAAGGSVGRGDIVAQTKFDLPKGQTELRELADKIKDMWSEFQAKGDDVMQTMKQAWDGFRNDGATIITKVADLINKAADVIDQAASKIVQAAEQIVNELSRARGKARGGLLGGRGTGTSDSNLAWVSRGEHIMPARAVAQPGVLAFLEALRRSGGDLSRVLDGMGRFALGGMVPRAIPAFAMGGLAGGGNHVTISSGVVEQLQKAAALAQVRSGGRKPSRYS